MKSNFIYIVFLATVFAGSAQENAELISLGDYYKMESVIFEKDYKPPFSRLDFDNSFTLTIEQIERVEKILIQQYNSSKIWMVDNLRKKNPSENLVYPKTVKNVRKKFCKYRRQYVGYINWF